ncbi:hypothetical protein [Rhizobium herbae]|uniref:Uncharacterized protein n=1 Tax=Rhizobium herbae TaxID=508661 RepID=A0ABS4EPA0_9HYPH|nr:hypothetical protein [Rhizobium herbae]MBP1859774.1 hypothetical protein [Rhizobium herbae]
MTPLENWEELKAMAKQDRQRERESIAARLEAGEEIDLLEAISYFEIRRKDGLWPLADLRAVGRIGDEAEPPTEIPGSAWLHLRWSVENGDFVVVTTTGKKIFDLRFCARELGIVAPREADGAGNSGADQEAAPAPAERVVTASEEPSVVLQRIVKTKRPEGSHWEIDAYKTEFAKAGITVIRGKHDRLSGVKICDDGRIERAGGSIYLTNALLVTRFALAKSDGFLSNCRSKRDVARALYRWLDVDHPNILGVRVETPDDLKTIDGLADLLRRHFRDFLAQVSGGGSAG